MIALKINRAGPGLIGPKRSAGASEHGLVVYRLLTVMNHRQVAVHERDVERLPFAGRFRDVFARENATVERAAIVVVVPATEGVRDLYFVNAPQINATVAVRRHAELNLKVEI